MTTFTILDEGHECRVKTTASHDRTLIAPAELTTTLGWELKPEGLCKGSACYPVSQSDELLVEGAVDLERFAAKTGRPLALCSEHGVAALGTAATVRADSMENLKAPNFTLPDLDGRMHSLSEHRGKKVFLVAHASW